MVKIENSCPVPKDVQGGWFNFNRNEGYPSRYADQNTRVFVDILILYLVLAFLMLAICFYIILPAFTVYRRRCVFSQVTFSLFIGGIILVGNFGHEWEIGHVQIKSPYKAGTGEEIKADLTLHVALRGINITLKGKPVDPLHSKDLLHETIDYNEHFSWEWEQGRFGFGKYAGRLNREFRASIIRGIPLPILQVAEYFTFDGEGIRFGRHYRLAGWYSHIMMWTAFSMWIVTNILFFMVVRSGASLLVLTGIFQLIAVGIWTFLRNPTELHIPFESPHQLPNGKPMEEVILQTSFGSTYYFVFGNGCLCVVLGLFLLILDMFIPDQMCQFFGIDPLTIYEEYVLTVAEVKKEQETERKNEGGPRSLDSMEKGVAEDSPTTNDNMKPFRPLRDTPDESTIGISRIRPSFRLRHQIKQSFKIKPNVTPRKVASDDADMESLQRVRYNKKPNAVTISHESQPLLQKSQMEKVLEDDEEPIYDNLPELRRNKQW